MTVQAKSKRRTKYRAIERPDGLIVLHRPYQPANSPPQHPPSFEKHLPTLEIPSASRKTKGNKPLLVRVEHDFAHMSSHLAKSGRSGCEEVATAGRGGYNDCMDAGRGGHNDFMDREEELCDLVAEMAISRAREGLTPVQRFLQETGPWSSFRLRES